MPTLTVDELLQDVIDAFKVNVPGINNMSTQFTGDTLKLNKTYTAHVAGLPTVTQYDAGSGGYQANATDIRTLLTDVDITVDQHPKVSLYASHLNAIADDKKQYGKVIGNMGFALAKDFVTHVSKKFNARNISQSSTYTTGNSDYDAIEAIRTAMNTNGASPLNRVGIVNSDVASTLHLDTRVLSNDYRGEMATEGANAFRAFRNIGGFESVMEWPELPTHAADAVTLTSGEADDEIILAAAAHGLLVGDRVIFPTLTGGSGLTAASTIYYVVSVPSTTTFTVSATSGGSAVNFTTDISAGTVQRVDYLTGMFWEPRAIAVMSGIPDDLDGAAQLFGAPPTYGITTVTDESTGITMVAISEAQQGTLKGFLHITFVYGASVGKQAAATSAGALTDKAGHRLVRL
jgi:hypothetical protein